VYQLCSFYVVVTKHQTELIQFVHYRRVRNNSVRASQRRGGRRRLQLELEVHHPAALLFKKKANINVRLQVLSPAPNKFGQKCARTGRFRAAEKRARNVFHSSAGHGAGATSTSVIAERIRRP
jgi:hypothetical protein